LATSGGAQASIILLNAGDAQSGITNARPKATTPILTTAIVSVITSALSIFTTTVGSTTIFSPASGLSSGARSVLSNSLNVSINSLASVTGTLRPIATSSVSLSPAYTNLSLGSWAVIMILMLLV
jgi:hypothetical protein